MQRRVLAGQVAFAVAAALSVSENVSAQDEGGGIEEVTIIGSQEQARRLTGAAHFIGPEELRQFN